VYILFSFVMQNLTGSQEDTRNQFKTRIHTEQISQYLPLLNQKAIDLINKSQERTDSIVPIYGDQYTNEYHFDNNKLSESTSKINAGYRELLQAFSDKPDEIFLYFGRITHALQDFYSHSNWYELSLDGFTGDQRLLDEGYGFFEELKPLKSIGSTKVVALEQGFKDPITAWGAVGDWFVNSNTYVVSTTTDRGEIIGGLMSAEVNGILYGLGKSVPILDPVTNQTYKGFDHGGLAGTISNSYLGPLAKDKADDRYHSAVLELARDQVQHELVRMISLIQSEYGNKGLRKFSDLFVRESRQQEFEELIKSRGFTLDELVDKEVLNTLNDNTANDEVIDDFFKDGNPDVAVIPDTTREIPKEIADYGKEIEAGQFRWVESDGLASDGSDFVLQIRTDGTWLTTSFTSNESLEFR
jgi:hypothetical protein